MVTVICVKCKVPRINKKLTPISTVLALNNGFRRDKTINSIYTNCFQEQVEEFELHNFHSDDKNKKM